MEAITFFKVDKYEYTKTHVFDVSSSPRPHFCMGLLLEGSADITDSENGNHIHLEKGDIIFVPINSTYVSKWVASPRAIYISLHFILEMPSPFSRQHSFRIQKISCGEGFEKIKENYEFILNNYDNDYLSKLSSMSKFYEILSEIYPELDTKKEIVLNDRIVPAINYIERNYSEDITVDFLAGLCNMSTSRFFPNFKKYMGETPVEYINDVRVGKAIVLMYDNNLSIEQISEMAGFKSSIYFRKIFKKKTGKTPTQYKKTSMEL
ncbi:MAG: helix-turn-helix transcriptional regulator [Clostridia bacterium]|nr:helix-turn-helix transcriptional regulator [Clostridia bacterium]